MAGSSTVTVRDLEFFADKLDPAKAAAAYLEHGAIVIRGLLKRHLPQLVQDIEASAAQAISLLDQAKRIPEGWSTPDGTLFLPAPKGYKRDKQIMVLGVNYRTSGAFFQSAFEERLLDVVEAIVGPDIELFIDGQCLYKEPVGGHPKHLHQDAAYFEHRFEGPVGVLNYAVDTDLRNGALHVVPGSHRMGVLKHVDTFSHLGLDPAEWTWDKALPIIGQAGDAIFFHVKTIHGSRENMSDKARPVFIHRYRRADDYVVVHATSQENRQVAERRIEEAKKENQRGLMVRGFRRLDTSRPE
ncbi:MAG: phytanoyl-CoA dioxygenase family protein [Planctomycetota bacterium]|nr:phytanoyl-CoA dioxygenase family protein [Planctomycetota bacterium]